MNHAGREGLAFWERQWRSGSVCDLKRARHLPNDTPEFILQLQREFEERAEAFCFAGSKGMVLDAGCGKGNLLLKSLETGMIESDNARIIGIDFSSNMLSLARLRAMHDPRAAFVGGCITSLPFADR